MAKGNLKSSKKSKKQNEKAKKGGKGKWFLLFFLFLLILLGVGFYYFYGNPLDLFFNESNMAEEQTIDGTFETTGQEVIIQDADEIIKLENSAPIVDVKKPAKPKWKQYFIRVEDCLALTCEQEVVRFLKQEKLPYSKKKSTRKTKYYELISTSIFSLQTANEKLDILKHQNDILGQPYLIKENNRYRISMGFFPQEDTGVRMRSELANVYPETKVDFDIRPVIRSYTITSIFAGPFKKNTAAKVLQRLHDYPQYEDTKITLKF